MLSGELQLKEHSSVQLVSIENLPGLDWVEADVKIVDQILGMKEKIMDIMKNKTIVKDTTLVLGASPKSDRYSNMAVNNLKLHNHSVIALGNTKGMINGTEITTDFLPYQNIHTVTLYISPKNQSEYYDYIISLKPERVIFNPGTENTEFYQILKEKKIEYLEACTLVMLSTGQY
jgi:predicted CoA-binding protein